MGPLAILGLEGTALGMAPLAGPAIDLATGEMGYQTREKVLSRGPDADGNFRTNWMENLLIDEGSLKPQYDKRQLKELLKNPEVVKRMGLCIAAPTIGTDLSSYLSSTQSDTDTAILDKARETSKILEEDKYNSPTARDARARLGKLDEIAAEDRNFNRYLKERALISDERDRQDRIEQRKISRDDKLLARQQSLDLGMAKLAQLKSSDQQNYNLALQKMERDSKLAHQQKIASIIGGIGNIGMLMAA